MGRQSQRIWMNLIKTILFLLLGSTGFALTVTDRGTSGNTTAQASTAFAPASTIAAGSGAILYIAADNSNGSSNNMPLGTLTDSAGNSWYRIIEAPGGASANATLETAMYLCPALTTQLTSGGNLTITYAATNVTSKIGSFIEVAPATAGNIIIANKDSNSSGSASTTASVVSSVAMIGQLSIGGAGVEDASVVITGDADTSNGSWSTAQTAGVGTTTTGMQVVTQWKIQATAASNQTFNPTWSASADSHADVVTFQEADSRARGFNSNIVSQASSADILQGLSVPMATGSTCVLAMALDNNGLNGAVTNVSATDITDSQGNVWKLRQNQIFDNGTAAQGAEVAVWTSTLTHGLVRQDTMTVTYGGVNATGKAWAFWEFTNATAYANSGNGGAGTGTTPSITTGSITSPNIVVGVLASEGDSTVTGTSDATNGTWKSGIASDGGSGGAGSITVATQYKATTGTGTQTYNPTLGASQDNVLAWVELTVPGAFTLSPKIPNIPTIK